MGKELLIIIRLKSMRECQCVMSSRHLVRDLPFELILEVHDVLADSVPANSIFLLLLITKAQNLHAIVV